MTENKRYGFVDGAITDTLTNDRLVSTSEYICELNGLHNLVEKYKTRAWQLKKENEQLKSEIEKLSYVNEDLLNEKRNWSKMSDEYAKLYQENKQLKKELTHKKVLLDSLQDKYGGLLKLVHGFGGSDD